MQRTAAEVPRANIVVTNPTEFAAVHGVGAAKLRDLAEPFLDAIRDS